jgi:hypothetical protein
LTEAAKAASTFEEIREAGERFGKIIGREAARAFAMLLVAAIGSTAQLFAAKVPTLPGSAQVAMQAEGMAKISLSALGSVEEIALTAVDGAHAQAFLQARRRCELLAPLALGDAQGWSGPQSV